MIALDERRVPRIARGARLRFDRHEGRMILLAPERGLVLNESAAAIVAMCDGTRCVAEIVAALAQDTGARREVVARDVLAFLAALDEKGLVR